MDSSEPAKLLVPYVSGLIILCISVLWLVDQFVIWLRDRTSDFPFEPLIATVSALGLLLISPGLGEKDWAISWVIFLIALAVLIWMMGKMQNIRKWQFQTVIAIFVLVNIILFWNYNQNNLRGETIKVMLQTEPDGQSIDNYWTRTWERSAAEQFQKDFGVKVEIIPVKTGVSKRLDQFLEALDPELPPKQGDEVDVFAIDVIWTGILARHAANLQPIFQKFSDNFNSHIFDNDKVRIGDNTKLVAVPWFIDNGLLFYRKDLLKKYFNSDLPPDTWQELEKQAIEIQNKERSIGNKHFWGFVWQGDPSEGLVCNALEWQFSHGGGTIVAGNKVAGNKVAVDINVEATTKAFERAKNWIGKISPSDILIDYDHKKAYQTWRKGNAAFMRNWLYAYSDTFQESPEFPNLQGNVGVTLLPKGDDKNATYASTLGGWQLMINARTQGRQKKAAIEFLKFLISTNEQKSLALKTGKVPALKELYTDAEVLQKLPFLNDNEDNSKLNNLFTGESPVIARRPSSLTDRSYPIISEVYLNGVRDILQGNIVDTRKAVETLRDRVKNHLNT
ncbi:hypothetical protein BV378_21945 [Nostoc sp. RF31YmG]|nr:hypothetical protein BV378_21945 [Nostoc sp. RF31YmG]